MKSVLGFFHHSVLVLSVTAAAFFTVSCVTADGKVKTAEQPAKRIRAALYLDSGSAGNGVFHWGRLLAYSPQIEAGYVNGQDIQDGKLKDYDLLVMPGGYSVRQYKSMQEKGAEKVREFIRGGGAYVGTCAGFACVLNAKNIRRANSSRGS